MHYKIGDTIMKHTFAIFIAFLVIVFAIASCQPSVTLPPAPGKFVGPIGKAGVYPAWASPGGNKFTASPTNIYMAQNETSMTELSARDDFVWNKFYTLSNEDQWIEHDVTCTVFPNSNWCTNTGTADIDLDWDTYYDGQNYALGYTCTILPNNQFDCSGGRWKLIWFNLTTGEAPETPDEDECSDSDDGSIWIRGNVTFEDQDYQDTCYNPTTNQTVIQCNTGPDCQLKEYSCVNDAVSSSLVSCSIGCVSGACLNDTCVDPDGGLDNRTATTASYLDMVINDGCHGNMVLQEAYCDDDDPQLNKLKMQEIVCPYGCANGICLLPSEAVPFDLVVDSILAKSNGRLEIVVKNIGQGAVIPIEMPISLNVTDASGNSEITGSFVSPPYTPLAVYNRQEALLQGYHITTSVLTISYNQNVTAVVDWQNNLTESNENNNAKSQMTIIGTAAGT
ncbi:hypothetical protein KY335_04790 [Candidatus Woesearchaeota archaeon]|nr:hypothetical protein [Candidatus Woesearchaeota archaeon]MBW3014525.1 hypothetical protein [Candidatus Woesearchaeota archaeon]